MAAPTGPRISVRAVRGRVVDPFRGTPDGDDPQRLASRETDAQPLDDVMAALQAMPGVTVERAGRRFVLKRGDDVARVAFASAAPRVSLDDATFEGDGALVLSMLAALLPLFGAVEVTIGRFVDLVDGHEPMDAVLKRYEAWWIDDSLKLAKKLEARDSAKVTANVAPAPAKARRPKWLLHVGLLAAFILIGAGVIVVIRVIDRADVGERCVENDDCDSNRCLPHEPVHTIAIGSAQIGGYTYRPPSNPEGVCTRHCTTDGDCPWSMQCGDIMSYGSFGLGTRAKACVPREMHDGSGAP